MNRLAVVVVYLALSLGLTACDRPVSEPGVVAKVNGRPIALAQLQFKHDLMHTFALSKGNPTLSELRKEYGSILAELVVQELIDQELENRGLAVSDQELAAAEADIRSDYPEGAFEQTVIEEYIDLDAWRQQLRARLARDKFLANVLRPQVRIDYQEAESYYREHLADFYLPPRLTFLMVGGPSKELVTKAVQLHFQGAKPEDIATRFRNVEARLLKMREDRVPNPWRETLAALKEGQASPVTQAEAGYRQFVLVEKTAGRTLEPSQAYPLVEGVLLEKKLGQAFESWLDFAVSKADIKVSARLLAPSADELAEQADGAPQAVTGEAGGPGGPDANVEELEFAPAGETDRAFDEQHEVEVGSSTSGGPARPGKQ
jgi:parvulin-like peptidyl-prolyl isomerase